MEITRKYKATRTAGYFHQSKALFRGIRGPIGSSKSVTCSWELFRLATQQEPFNKVRKSRWAAVRQTYPELKSTTIKTWQDWFPPSICPIKFDAPITGLMKLPLPDGTQLHMELVFLALEREEDAKKLLSLELTGIWFNEARELPFRIVEAAMGRIGRFPSMMEGGHTRKAAIADSNPSSDDHWWFKLAEEGRLNEKSERVSKEYFEFFAQPPALIRVDGGGYVPNPDAENINNLKDGYRYYLDQIPGKDPNWINVYILGNYGVIQDGKPVYGNSYNDALHCSSVAFTPVTRWPVVIGVDFGLTPAAVFLQQTPRGQIRMIEEITTEQTGIRQMARDLIKPRLLSDYKDCRVMVTGDPAGMSKSDKDTEIGNCYDILREELRGLIVEAFPYDDASNSLTRRLDGVRTALGRLSDGKAFFQISPECKALRRGFLGAYKFRKVRVVGDSERYMETPDKSHPVSDVHDALQYGLAYLLGDQMRSGMSQGYTRATSVRTADAVAGY